MTIFRWYNITNDIMLYFSSGELLQDRIASEFSRLQYLMSLSNQHAMIKSLEPVSNSCAMVTMLTIL